MILTRGQVERIVELAITAPSVLNTQPWQFFAHSDRIDVQAVPARGLPAVDPAARETFISCGAAVFNLRLGIGALRRTAVVRLLPNPDNPALVASVRIGGPMTLPAEESQLFDAITRRRTSREPFSAEPVSDLVRNALAAAAHREGADVDFVPRSRRDAVVAAVHEADLAQRLSPKVVEEIDRWTIHREENTSGIAPSAFGPKPSSDDATVRDFALGGTVAGRETADFSHEDLLALLLTSGDDRLAWVRAGLALQRVLLTATVHQVSSGMLTSPLEVPTVRDLLLDRRTTRGHPQVLLRFGYGPEPPATPRRSVANVLMPVDRRLHPR
jgi:nitroreductase